MDTIDRRRKALRMEDMCAQFGLSRTTIWRRVKDGTIPPPVKIGRLPVWPADVVDRVLGGETGE